MDSNFVREFRFRSERHNFCSFVIMILSTIICLFSFQELLEIILISGGMDINYAYYLSLVSSVSLGFFIGFLVAQAVIQWSLRSAVCEMAKMLREKGLDEEVVHNQLREFGCDYDELYYVNGSVPKVVFFAVIVVLTTFLSGYYLNSVLVLN